MKRYKIKLRHSAGIEIITVSAETEHAAKEKLKLIPTAEVIAIKEVKETI
jgi:hypothetical protein